MNQTLLIVLYCIGIIAFILHSYLKRGLYLTLNFFLFAFMLIFTKGGEHSFKFMNLVKPAPGGIIPAAISTLIWVISFYLSWCIGQKVVERIPYFKNRIFPVLLFAGLFVAAIAYALETTAMNSGVESTLMLKGNDFLLIPLEIVKRQFYFSVYFLAAFFLIACSEYKNKDWKIIFFILPFIHTWIPQFFGLGLVQSIEEILILIMLIGLAFISPLCFYQESIQSAIREPFLKIKKVDSLPVVFTVILIVILGFIDVVKLNNPKLLIALLPLGFFVLLAVKRIPLFWIVFIALLCCVVLKIPALLVFVPVGLLILFELVSKTYLIKNNSLA